MKILVSDNRLYPLESEIGGCFGIGEHAGSVEHIKSLVLHRPHIKVVHGDDHENIEIVFPPIDLLIPAHRILQRAHGVITLIDILLFDKDAQLDLSIATGHKPVVKAYQIACD